MAMEMEFEWHPAKAEYNLNKHGISFVLAAHFLQSGHYILLPSDHASEPRILAVGSYENCIITVVFTHRHGKIRIISARKASREERRTYRDLQS